MRDWQRIRWNLIVAGGTAVGVVLLAAVALVIMALGEVWGPGWLGDLVDRVVG